MHRSPASRFNRTARRWRLRLNVLIGAALLALAGCSWQQAFLSAQGWQRNQCNRLTEQAERDRCLKNTKMSYEDYRRQTEGTKKD
jgi:hypothetical protein